MSYDRLTQQNLVNRADDSITSHRWSDATTVEAPPNSMPPVRTSDMKRILAEVTSTRNRPAEETRTASELAYGAISSAMPAKQLTANSKPRPEAAGSVPISPPQGWDNGPIRVDPDAATDRQKIAGFEQVANSHIREAAAPSHVRLPNSIGQELDGMWAESRFKDQEQGGNLVRTYRGRYEIRRTHDSSDSSDTYHSDTSNIGRFDHHAALIHTHPLGPSEPDYVSFSDVDLENLVDQDQPLNILRSGQQTYMVARTKEFDAMIDKDNDPHQMFELKMAMRRVYEGAFRAEQQAGGSHPSAVEKGVIAVCRTFHLIYYWGQGQDLHRIR